MESCVRNALAALFCCTAGTGCSSLFGFDGFGDECADRCEAGAVDGPAEATHDASGGAERDSGPTGLALGMATATVAAVGDITGHESFSDVCPPGQVVVGYAGQMPQAGNAYMQIQSTCGTLVLSASSPWNVTIGPGMSFPVHGMEPGTAWTAMCPANQAIVGFIAQYNTSIDGLTLSCAPLVVSADGTTVSVGAATMLPFVGQDNTRNVTGTCAAGSIATATSGWYSTTGSVTGFGLSCSPVSLTF